MNTYITLFLLFGAFFGMATFTRRHLFNEGPRAPDSAAEAASVASRIMWVMVCVALWPLMVIAGINTAWIMTKRKRLLRRPGI
jgi:hypothetical protein